MQISEINLELVPSQTGTAIINLLNDEVLKVQRT